MEAAICLTRMLLIERTGRQPISAPESLLTAMIIRGHAGSKGLATLVGGGRIGELVIWNRVLTEREVQDGVFGRGRRNLELSMRSMLEDRLVWGELHIFSVVRLTDIRLWISENVVQAHGRFCKR